MSNHLVKKTLQLMTVKEVAAGLGIDPRSIQLKVKELFPDIVKNGVTTMLTQTQVTAVKLNLEKKFEVQTDLEKELIILQAMQLQQERYNNMQLQLQQKDNIINDLQIELDEEKSWYSVKRIKSMGFLQDINARKLWSPLKKWSIVNDYQIKTIFDANYGNIKTYHRDAWSAVYKIDFEMEF